MTATQQQHARSRRPLVSVVMPAYNEAGMVETSLAAICNYLEEQEHRFRYEVVAVNDGSTDDTGKILDGFASSHLNVRVIHQEDNSLLGQALRSAFVHCRGDYVVTMDCDLSYAPVTIGRLVDEAIGKTADVVIASPYMRGGSVRSVPWSRWMASMAANRFLSFTAGGHISTITSMVRAYDGTFLRSLDLKSHGSEINAEIIYKAQLLRARIREIPAELDWTSIRADRAVRKASTRVTRTTSYTLLSAFFFRPFMFFIIPGLLLLLLSAVCILIVSSARGLTLAGVLAVTSVQLIALGVVALQAKRYFEDLFHLGTAVLRGQRATAGTD